MAVFGKKEKVSKKVTSIRPFIVRTEKVSRELKLAAKNLNIDVNLLDFELISTQTFIRVIERGKEKSQPTEEAAEEIEWEEVEYEDMKSLTEKETMLNPTFFIKQIYEVEIKTKEKNLHLSEFNLNIGANGLITKVVATVKAGSRLVYYKDLKMDIKSLVLNKKLRAGLFVGLWDSMLDDGIDSLVAQARVADDFTLEDNYTFVVARTNDPKQTINDAMLLHYNKKVQNEDEFGRIDYSQRGFVKSVEENELVMEYIKPQIGTPGRNCKGAYIAPRDPVVKHEPTFTITSNIEARESDEKIEYIAKRSGYIVEEDGVYDISDNVEVDEISFKSTGAVDAGIDNEVTINISQQDIYKDAIGAGMEVEAKEINIDGNVASGASVRSHTIEVKGQTHQTSLIETEQATINTHKGTLYAKEAHIERLENGSVEADVVTIGQAIGGNIKAKEVYIDTIGSHVSIEATKRIEIKIFQGRENKFLIDPTGSEDNAKALEKQKEEIKQSKKQLLGIKKELDKKLKTLQANEPAMIEIKKRLTSYKRSGITMPVAFISKLKQFAELKEMIKELKVEYEEKHKRDNLLNMQHDTFQDSIFRAKVMNRDKWRGHNEVKFHMLNPEIDVEVIPKEGSRNNIFMVKKIEMGDEEEPRFEIYESEITEES